MALQIVEIIGPCEQGMAEPVKCLGEDGHVYYVKGMQSGRSSLCKEWMCACLARQLNFNIPPFCVVEISRELLLEAPQELRKLGWGLAFGSQEYKGALWFEASQSPHVDVQTQQDILAFDWWIANGDRTCGNPNLLYDTSLGKLVVIDHNAALDEALTFTDFCDHHVFGAQADRVFFDLVAKQHYAARFRTVCVGLPQWVAQMPDAWRWANYEQDVPSAFVPEVAMHTLISRTDLSTGNVR